MNKASPGSPVDRLAAAEGRHLLNAHEALVKGCLESDVELSLVVGPQREPFAGLFELAARERPKTLLREHGIQVTPVPHAGRGVALGAAAARSGGCALALVPNDQLDQSMMILHDAGDRALPRGGSLVVLLDDRPLVTPFTCPRQAAARLGIACMEPGDIGELRDGVEQALRLSRSDGRPVGLVVHHSILRTADTIAVRPNRVHDTVDAMIVARTVSGRRSRRTESGGGLRTARRLELNRTRCLPSPGERVSVGFVAVGPAVGSLRHLTQVLRLHGRVPTLELRLVSPVDEAAVERLAQRCDHLVVLEPRPGHVQAAILQIVERLRREGGEPAAVWGRSLPPEPDGTSMTLGPDDVGHPSILARKILHLLHSIRPTSRVAAQLVPTPAPSPETPLVPRAADVGVAAAIDVLRRMLEQVDEWLVDGAPLDERGIAPSRLAIDGIRAAEAPSRVVVAEIWDPARFQEEGISALRQAARDGRAWLFVVCDFASEDTQDLERLARAVIPEERAERVRLVVQNLDDLAALRESLREAALEQRLTVVIVRDGPPARYHVAAQERAATEVDRLGYEPQQRSVRPPDDACAFRETATGAALELRGGRDAGRLHSALSVDRLPKRVSGRLRLGVRLLQESVEVVRSKAPAQTWRRGLDKGLPLPAPRHGAQASWRAHLAGFRGAAPGPAAIALSEAARSMGLAVCTVHDPTPIGMARRAWAQVLLTNPRPDEEPSPLAARIPFGEADLLLGLDPAETLRALATDPALHVAVASRTSAVVNRGGFAGEATTPATRQVDSSLAPTLVDSTDPEQLVLEDVAAACRAWFRTDRVTDVALLGLAFQRGLVPLSLEALEIGLGAAEARGFARSPEAFSFGRRLALEPRLLARPRDDTDEDLERMIRRTVRLCRRSRFGGHGRAERFERIVNRALGAMPGLSETEPGRRARRDFLLAVHRCAAWGGLDYAQRYADLVTALYREDRGDRGRGLTRNAVLPLAEAMLIREPLYVFALATGPERRRHLRRQFNVKPARGDRIEQSYLMRLELVARGRRARLDVGVGRGLARTTGALRRIVPDVLRGARQDRERRQLILDLVMRAASGHPSDYDRLLRALRALHGLTADDRLRHMSKGEIEEVLAVGSYQPSAISRQGADA